MKTLAKSLHSVTVLVRLSRKLGEEFFRDDPQAALNEALRILGYDGTDDPYDLVGAALKQLEAE